MKKSKLGSVGTILFFMLATNVTVLGIQLDDGALLNNTSPLALYDGTILYVGGTGPGNYSEIQAAIDDSSDGDTIFVYHDSSPYHENVQLNKAVALIGENRETTVINGDGNEDVLTISADNAAVTGFTLQEPDWVYDGIILHANNTLLANLNIIHVAYALKTKNANNNIIRDIDISEGRDLIQISNSNNNTIQRVTVRNILMGSIYVLESYYNQIIDNTLSDGSITLAESYNNTVMHNTFLASTGLYLQSANGNLIKDNIFADLGFNSRFSYQNIVQNNLVNGKPVIYLENQVDAVVENAGQVILIRCDNITVQNSQITSLGTGTGISLEDTTNSKIIGNTITSCQYGVYLHGAYLHQCTGIIISENTITECETAINVEQGQSNTIVKNTLQDNAICGISLYLSESNIVEENTITNSYSGINIFEGEKNTILGNTIEDNEEGLSIFHSNFNTIKNNNIIGNTHQAFFINSFCSRWTRNYWDKLLPTPKIIFGVILIDRPYPNGAYIIPILNIDLCPRALPYSSH